uniref:non-specific serine/threonine protein kinase n=1 Tax=Hanusia phi TaxID=3032 RepID=A0A7S0E0D5_9CRYP|mmetsp:Transcript_1392/g.3044  ORF Transcript_1392/g.3044 Transcript_1392/m.3044 type:complete len:621 (+) Transcript_1392:364-2226(+)
MEEDEPEHPDTPTDWDRRKSATRGTKNDSQGLSDLEDIIPVNQGRLHMYAVGKKIGSGKFSVVFRARMSDGRHVALKKINIFDMMDAKSRSKCLREVHMLRSISKHENLIEYLDAFIENNELMIVFEWAENGDLRRLLRKATAPFEEREVWKYFLQVAGAVAHMHEQRMMHRDIKPANIFISANNVLKLGDLGLGRVFSAESVETFSKVGTPLYMSPEVLHGQGYDFKSDIWSLGCLLYEFATLSSPFEAPNQNLYDIFKRINDGDFAPLPELFSQEIRGLVNRMLHKDPKKRPTASEAFAFAQMACDSYQERPSGLMMMIEIIDLCQLLDYQAAVCRPHALPPLTRSFFTHPHPQPEIKFRYLTRLLVWLLQLNEVYIDEEQSGSSRLESLDPLTASSLLLDACKKLSIGNDISPVRLKTGYGEAVCSLLHSLLHLTLARRKQTLPLMSHQTGEEEEEEQEVGTIDVEDDECGWPATLREDVSDADESEQPAAGAIWKPCESEDLDRLMVHERRPEGWRNRMEDLSRDFNLLSRSVEAIVLQLRGVVETCQQEASLIRTRENRLNSTGKASNVGELREAAEELERASALFERENETVAKVKYARRMRVPGSVRTGARRG